MRQGDRVTCEAGVIEAKGDRVLLRFQHPDNPGVWEEYSLPAYCIRPAVDGGGRLAVIKALCAIIADVA